MTNFKVYTEEEELQLFSTKIESLNKDLLQLTEMLNSLNQEVNRQDIKDLENDILKVKEDINKARYDLLVSEELNNKKIVSLISGGLGSLVGGTVGVMLISFSGPATPIITTFIGGISGYLYSIF